MKPFFRFTVALVALLVCAACSDDAEDAGASSPSTSTTTGTGGAGGGSSVGGGGTANGGGGGVGGAGGTSATTFAEERVYTNDVFATPEECRAAQQEGVNCQRVVQFCPDGRAAIMATDIVVLGSYTLGDATVHASWRSGDVPMTMDFSQTSDTVLVDEQFELIWTWQMGEVGLIGCRQ